MTPLTGEIVSSRAQLKRLIEVERRTTGKTETGEALPLSFSCESTVVMSETNIKRTVWSVFKKKLQKTPFKSTGGILVLAGLVYLLARKADSHFEISVEKLKIEVNGPTASRSVAAPLGTNNLAAKP